MIEELSTRIWSHDRFHNDFRSLQELALRRRYISLETPEELDIASLSRLLQSATTLAASEQPRFREMAYRIVVTATDVAGHKFPGISYLMLVALGRMGNFPALRYAKKYFSIDESSLPTREYAESNLRELGNSISLGDVTLSLTDFQYDLWKKLSSTNTLGISAPTSAGKSFVLQSYAHQAFLEGKANNIAFIVPTRALINQLSEDVSAWLTTLPFAAELITTPVPEDSELPDRGIYILTQERLQLLHTAHSYLQFQLMLVDEAQSIADGPRGVLLYAVVKEALRRNEGMQLLFAGPNLGSPEKIARLFRPLGEAIKTTEAAVVQNIFFVDSIRGKPKAAQLSLLSDVKKVELGDVLVDQRLTDHRSKLVQIALRLGEKGQNLIYAGGPAECEKIAFGLSDTEDETVTPEQDELSAFIKDAVHPKFQLANDVTTGVGFHYGRLPSLVRKAVEDAFSNGTLHYLVTTSTLLHGVNMPPQNLFLHNPQKGRNEPISPSEFWNLAGRAGRLGKEFSGNIFLIDYGTWPSDPMAGEKEVETVPTIETHVSQQTEELIQYISDPQRVPDRNKPDEYENTFVHLVRSEWNGVLEDTLTSLGLTAEQPLARDLIASIRKSVEGTDLSPPVLEQSPTVSVHRQQSLFERLESSLSERGTDSIIPRHPLEAGAFDSYSACIKRCHDTILKYPAKDRSHIYFAQSCLRWMKGEPLPSIIDNKIEYQRSIGREQAIATVIRNTLSEVEQDLRFKYVRLFSCYNAVLGAVLKKHDLEKYVSSIPPIPLFLEVGACTPTMISFMGLGLSRYTSGKLQQLPRRADMSQTDARNWILRQDIEALDLPAASIKEIRRMVPRTG